MSKMFWIVTGLNILLIIAIIVCGVYLLSGIFNHSSDIAQQIGQFGGQVMKGFNSIK